VVPGLLERLGRPTTLIVGKGGVGKTTTAGGLGLALADSGRAVHLLSTDPAHSLGDLFQQTLAARPVPSRCTDRLILEELDMPATARRRLDAVAPALREVIEGGTYLDEEDAESLVGGALPGLDELGAAFRIAELAATGVRLVVDTAPAGHTLRMLDSEAMVRGWLNVFEAMAAKASAVASALVGAPARLQAERELRRLAGEMAAFTAVLRAADFLIVTAPGAAVGAGTTRLTRALQERGLKVVASVAAGRPGVEADVRLPLRAGLVGCDALRSWWRAGHAGPGKDAEDPRPGPQPGVRATVEPVPAPFDRELVAFTGKGGVGKSTCAAALASRLAAEGRVTLVGADPAGSLTDVLASSVPGLILVEADAEAELERLKARYRQEVYRVFEAVGLDETARLDRAIVESFWDAAPPGMDELVAIGRMADDASADAPTILDTAPTGHFLRLMAMPELALDWTHRLMRILLKYRAVGGLDAPAERLIRLARRLRALRERLSDPNRTAIVVVTLDEPLVRAETRRLLEELARLGLPAAAVLVNRCLPAAPPAADTAPPGTPVFRAPEVRDPRGAALRPFAEAWEQIA
jgi:arsenite/tail-anchored protein-transporting ATPase